VDAFRQHQAGKALKKYLLLIVVLVAVYAQWRRGDEPLESFNESASLPSVSGDSAVASDDPLARAHADRLSGVQVSGEGTVVRMLGDDSMGDRHQRFVLELSSGQTLLIAHNIDIAPRVDSLQEGDTVSFNGEYEWNDKGGVVHWTHRDPQGQHEGGWTRHRGRTFQ
jgi:Protein of unknown function (DUF3465)